MMAASQGPRRAFWAATVFILVILVRTGDAQQRQTVAYASDGTPLAAASTQTIDLLVGRSAVLSVAGLITRISLTVPDVADALVTSPQEILIHGKAPGTISLFIWQKTGVILTYEVTVRRDLNALSAQLVQLFPGEQIQVTGNAKDVVLSGQVSTQYVVEKAADVAAAYVEKKEDVVNLLKRQEGVASRQVLLRVRFAEVSRSAVQELGASLFTGAGGFHDYVARSTTQQFPAPTFDTMTRDSTQGVNQWGGGRDTVTSTGGQQTFSDFLNLFLFNNKYNVGALVQAMQSKGVFQSLAEPNLVAIDGKEASFLAGGEYPYPVVQGTAGGTSISIQFKEFGVRLKFTPTILGGDLINLKIEPEVSALDFTNAVTIQGFQIPALSTRRTQTEVELRDGQTFAVAGLLNNTAVSNMRKIPGIGDIPILGLLFKSRSYEKHATELVVMITPQILPRNSTGAAGALPNLVEPYLTPPVPSFPPPPPYLGPGAVRQDAASPAPSQGAAKEQAAAEPVAGAPTAKGQTEQHALQDAERQQKEETTRAVDAQKAAARAAADARKQQDLEAKAAAAKAEQDKKVAVKAAAHAKKQQDLEAKAASDAKKRQDLEAKAAAAKAEEDRKNAEKAAREQAKKDAAAAKQAAEAKRKADEDQKKAAPEEEKRRKALDEAAAKVKEAQRALDALSRAPGRS